MGLIGYRSWVNLIQRAEPHRGRALAHAAQAHHVAVQEQSFATGFSRWVKGQAQGLSQGAFKLWVNWMATGTQPHHQVPLCSAAGCN